MPPLTEAQYNNSSMPIEIPPLGPTKLFLIEDDSFISEIYVRKFTLEGHQVTLAESGEDALAKLADPATPRPDIILCDVVMPGMGGFEFIRRKFVDPAIKDIPLIMLTNVSEFDQIDLAQRYGAIGYIVKANYTPTDILKKIAKYIFRWKRWDHREPFRIATI